MDQGAFPMGILHKLVFILAKLDPRNDQWRQRQIAKVDNLIDMAEEIDDSTVRRNTIRDLEQEKDNINEAFDAERTRLRQKTIPHRELHLRCGHPTGCRPDRQTPLLHFSRRGPAN